jgi:hypothetical protein
MPLDVINSRSFGRVIIQNAGDQVSSLRGDLGIVWEAVLVTSDSLVGCLDVVSFKWGFTDNESVNYHSQRPDVHFIRMALFALKNFGRNIIRSTADSPFALSVKL